MQLAGRISEWIRQKVKEAGAEGVVVGISGGVDSSVVASLAKKAVGEKVLGVIMPCHSEPLDEKYAWLVAEKLKIKAERVVLDSLYDRFSELLPSGKRLALANLKARLRMATLYYFANNLNYLVVGTGNKSEISVGYFTKYGDGGCDILPLGDLLKTEVRKLARVLELPEEIIDRVPSAGLWGGQTDEEEMGLRYEDLDEIISAIEADKRSLTPKEVVARVKRLIEASQHKRSPVAVFKKTRSET
ncbi:NAD+ synthase [Candidatus Aerophobetes bacterium]|uniref:NH(3)-dependent NAD(+) synthetase n=1 Tax=Aerophobetes bacterium TaxID=2030807 RepID=A0A523QFZ5_UNCAE|nr:MAG: NAD+ synthase [Candidatus Aerophobetes bacterium]